MDSPTTSTADAAVPNHHAHHPGFSGAAGVAVALLLAARGRHHARLAVELAGVGEDDAVVDVGSGPGTAARRAAALGAAVVGVDPSDAMRRVARALDRARGTRGVRHLEGTAEALPVEDGWATVAWSLATVHHWTDLGAGLSEVRRVLRPGGRFVALEREVAPQATGNASHGWVPAQAERFAALCRDAGLDAEVGRHRTARGPALSVVARRR